MHKLAFGFSATVGLLAGAPALSGLSALGEQSQVKGVNSESNGISPSDVMEGHIKTIDPKVTVKDWKLSVISSGYDNGRRFSGMRCIVQAAGLSFILARGDVRKVRVGGGSAAVLRLDESLASVDVIAIAWDGSTHKASFTHALPPRGEVSIGGRQGVLVDVNGEWVEMDSLFARLAVAQEVMIMFRRNRIDGTPLRVFYDMRRARGLLRRCKELVT